MNPKHIYMEDLHIEHKKWKSELLFQQDELKSFTTRLEEIVTKWTAKEVLSKVEQFQNHFIRHNEVIDGLLHHIKVHENELSSYAIDHPVATDHVCFDDHGVMRDSMNSQREIYSELKNNYLRFLTKVL